MKIHKLETGNFKLDGGAMFGVVPKTLWSKVYPADENNMCNLAMRCLLIETNDRKILIDAGLGKKQSDKFFSYYYLNGDDSLENSLRQKGIEKEGITDVILTHLHFDHCGGAVELSKNGMLTPSFANATYWVSQSQWEWAMQPNQREKASYLKENILPLAESKQLNFIEESGSFSEDIELRLYNGHSQGLAVPLINFQGRTLVFMADLLPTAAHIPASWICGFDTQPLVSMQEREQFCREAVEKNYVLFFEHDIHFECCTLRDTEKGIRMDSAFKFEEFQEMTS